MCHVGGASSPFPRGLHLSPAAIAADSEGQSTAMSLSGVA